MKRAGLSIVLALMLGAPAAAASLSVTKSSVVVSDPVNGTLNPRAIPGATVDYASIVTNPLANLLVSVRAVVLVDTLAPSVKLRVRDYGGAGSGPVEFTDGGLLLPILLGSGLSYRFTALNSASDGVEFFDGVSWSYVPQDDGSGYDPVVRAIRVTLTGTQIVGGSFRLRYRVAVR